MVNDNHRMISCAEMTAFWRSTDPQVSNDDVGVLLVSELSQKKCLGFSCTLNYPLIARKISVRAYCFYRQAMEFWLEENLMVLSLLYRVFLCWLISLVLNVLIVFGFVIVI